MDLPAPDSPSPLRDREPWRMRTSFVPSVFALLYSALVGCGGDARVPPVEIPSHIVLVTLDTTRADHLGAYGYFRDTSPHFDALAGESLLFEELVVPMATTLPTHLSILTSSHPLEHGVLANTTQGGERFVPAAGLTSFAMAAREAGYATGGFVSAAPLKRGSGIELGFDHYDEPADKHRKATATVDAALAWLDAQEATGPIFLWVHFYDAHWPFEAPAPFASRFHTEIGLDRFIAERSIHPTAVRPLVGTVDDAWAVANGYDAELLYQDSELGRLLDAVRVRLDWDRTAVIVSGEHGEGLCQHGEAAHGGTWHEQLRAPLAIRVAGKPARRVATPLTSADILPTLLAQLGGATRAAFTHFLAGAAGGNVLAEGYLARPILSQDTGREREGAFRYAMTFGGYKYFRLEYPDGRIEERLFDLGVDPYELRDVGATHVEMLADLRRRTEDAIASSKARGAMLRGGREATTAPADPKLRRELCALGYLAASECADLE